MRRAVLAVVLSVSTVLLGLSGAALAGVGDEALAQSGARPMVKHVLRAYGDGPVRLAYRQPGAISFWARRGDEVTLKARSKRSEQCKGRVTLTDGRGSRSGRVSDVPIFRVRSAGRATVRFEPFPSCGAADDPVSVQLMKLRGHKVPVDGEPVRLREPELGFYDVAWIRVPRTGRVKITGRNARGNRLTTDLTFGGDELRLVSANAVSVEPGLPLIGIPGATYYYDDPVLRPGTRVRVTFPSTAWVTARSALTHNVELDGPPVTLASGRGREHVLTVQLPDGIQTYLEPDYQWNERGYSYWLPPGPGSPTTAGIHRLVVASHDNAPYEERTLRIRSYRNAPDLVVGGPPVLFESVEPGQRFRLRVVASEDGPVRLAASDVNVTGGRWTAQVHPSCGHDCAGGAYVSPEDPVNIGYVMNSGSAIAEVRFERGARGSLTLTLTPEPR